ncbi:MAG: PepSY domain-containing protein [Acidobacteriota bacterium]|nr:PepSY domain-containing protein [Acidobacteriota bacterium]
MVRHFFGTVRTVHCRFGVRGDQRQVVRGTTDAAFLVFLFLVLNGLCLWARRRWSRRRVRNVGWCQRGLLGKARDFNLHNTVGLWMARPLVVIVASGVARRYCWATYLVCGLSGGEAPARPKRFRDHGTWHRRRRYCRWIFVDPDEFFAVTEGRSYNGDPPASDCSRP